MARQAPELLFNGLGLLPVTLVSCFWCSFEGFCDCHELIIPLWIGSRVCALHLSVWLFLVCEIFFFAFECVDHLIVIYSKLNGNLFEAGRCTTICNFTVMDEVAFVLFCWGCWCSLPLDCFPVISYCLWAFGFWVSWRGIVFSCISLLVQLDCHWCRVASRKILQPRGWSSGHWFAP